MEKHWRMRLRLRSMTGRSGALVGCRQNVTSNRENSCNVTTKTSQSNSGSNLDLVQDEHTHICIVSVFFSLDIILFITGTN